MTVEDLVKNLKLKKSDFVKDSKRYLYTIKDSNEFSHLYNICDSMENMEEDLDNQDIDLDFQQVTFVDVDGGVECDLYADFDADEYQLIITEV